MNEEHLSTKEILRNIAYMKSRTLSFSEMKSLLKSYCKAIQVLLKALK